MIRRIMVADTMSSPFAVLFTLAASTIHSPDRSTRDGGHQLVSESVLRYWIKRGGYFPTHNPTHKKYVLHELPRTLPVPAVL